MAVLFGLSKLDERTVAGRMRTFFDNVERKEETRQKFVCLCACLQGRVLPCARMALRLRDAHESLLRFRCCVATLDCAFL